MSGKVKSSTLATQRIREKHEEDPRAIAAAGELIIDLMQSCPELKRPEIFVIFLSLKLGISNPDRVHCGDPVFSAQRVFFSISFQKLVNEGFIVVDHNGLQIRNPPRYWGDVSLRFPLAPILSHREMELNEKICRKALIADIATWANAYINSDRLFRVFYQMGTNTKWISKDWILGEGGFTYSQLTNGLDNFNTLVQRKAKHSKLTGKLFVAYRLNALGREVLAEYARTYLRHLR